LPESFMVRRGSAVRVRQRALQKARKPGLFRSDQLARSLACVEYGAVCGASRITCRTLAPSRLGRIPRLEEELARATCLETSERPAPAGRSHRGHADAVRASSLAHRDADARTRWSFATCALSASSSRCCARGRERKASVLGRTDAIRPLPVPELPEAGRVGRDVDVGRNPVNAPCRPRT